jgi:RNA polymerase sigma factor for flagellar operon FliA
VRSAPLVRDRSCATVPGAEVAALVEAHLGLVQRAVAAMAGRVPRHVCWDDLTSAGMLGLTEAARSFDPERGVPFECFALTRIRGALVDELRSLDWASRSVRARARAVEAATEHLGGALGRRPTRAEVAARVELTEAELIDLSGDLQRAAVVHYDALAVSGDGPTGEDTLPPMGTGPDEIVLERERRSELLDALAALPERLRHVVVGSFLSERRLRDIAEDLGVTESRVSQLRTEALARLRKELGERAVVDLRAPGAALALA